jgi:hypothetical protein
MTIYFFVSSTKGMFYKGGVPVMNWDMKRLIKLNFILNAFLLVKILFRSGKLLKNIIKKILENEFR